MKKTIPMKKTIIAFAAITTLASSINAALVFELDSSFVSGDSTATWNISDGTSTGVLTATTTMASGFTGAIDSSTIGDTSSLNGTYNNVGLTNGGGVTFAENSPGTISYSYTGTNSLINGLSGGISSFDDTGGNTISITNTAYVYTTYNGNGMTNANTGEVLEVFDRLGTITGDNTSGVMLYEGGIFNATYEFGGTSNLNRTTLLSFGTAAFVPEPSSTALLGLGALSLLARRKR